MKKLVTRLAGAGTSIISALVFGASKVSAYTSSSTSDDGSLLLVWLPFCCSMVVGIPFLAFTIWMIVDAAKRDEKVLPGKIKWILLMVFFGFIPAVVYYFTRKKKM